MKNAGKMMVAWLWIANRIKSVESSKDEKNGY